MTALVPWRPVVRVASLDALRTGLVAWIIAGHAVLGYAAVGGWAYDEVNEVTLAPLTETVLAVLIGPSALFLMGTFFLVAGLFSPLSLERKGALSFAAARTMRLGVPFLASAFAVWPLSLWLAYSAAGQQVSYNWLLAGRHRTLDSGALWFAEVLLLFSLAYALWCAVRPRREGRSAPRFRVRAGLLVLLALAIALATFLVRLQFPARDTQIGDLHLWQWPQLAGMFVLGIIGAREGLARSVPQRLWRGSGLVVLASIAAIPLTARALGVSSLEDDLEPFLGGWYVESLLLASVEAVLVVFGSVWLLGFAQRAFSGTGRLARAAARGSFAAFFLQGPVLILLAVALRPLPAPAELKAATVALAGLALCFSLGWLLVTRTRLGRFL